jgi:hypothetical protein
MEPEDEWVGATGGRMVPVVQDGVEEESERREIEKKHSFYFFSILNLGFLKKHDPNPNSLTIWVF